MKKTTKNQEVIRHEKSISSSQNRLESPAIIAIEIVDDDADDETITKNTKRTIESSLGYGYHNSLGTVSKPKFEIYKYSQHDIPPYRGNVKDYFASKSNHQKIDGDQFQIQKSIRYDLGTRTQHIPAAHVKHQPGITLFTTLDQQGHVGEISEQVPSQAYQAHSMSGHVPIIILRVYTNQLANADNLYPNLPQNHPYSGLNSINLQSLLSNYMTSMIHHPQVYVQQQQQQQPLPQEHYHEQYHEQETHSGLQTHENYPDDAHTRVIFHKQPKQTKSTEVYYTSPAHNNYQAVTPAYMYITPEVTPSNYYYIEPAHQVQQQQQHYYQQQQYIYEPVHNTNNVETQQLYNYEPHTVPENKVEVLTHEGKGPTYLPPPTRKARASKRKHFTKKQEEA